MPSLAQRLAKIAAAFAAQTDAMQQLLADMRAAEGEFLAADASADRDTAAAPENEAAGRG